LFWGLGSRRLDLDAGLKKVGQIKTVNSMEKVNPAWGELVKEETV